MATIKAFKGIRPATGLEKDIAALPYDVYSREEACLEVMNKPLSFLNIDRAETGFSTDVDTYDEKVYQRAHDLLWKMVDEGQFIKDKNESMYLYELEMNGHIQTGIVACASVDDYLNDVIKKHENTRADKEEDRIKHVDTCNAQTGPVFLAYRENSALTQIINSIKEKDKPIYNFISDDGVRHTVYIIKNIFTIANIQMEFENIDNLYIADGHHRAASAVKAGLKRREKYQIKHKDESEFTTEDAKAALEDSEVAETAEAIAKVNSMVNYEEENDEYNYFLAVLFADSQLKIMDYNRIVKDLNGYSAETVLEKIKNTVDIIEVSDKILSPESKGQVTMYIDNKWYRLNFKDSVKNNDPVDGMDVSLLQNNILGPILNIEDPKTDDRIEFVGGIRGLDFLETRNRQYEHAVSFAMYPVSMEELFAVADAGRLMPPKSTWFEPKLRSGLFIHEI